MMPKVLQSDFATLIHNSKFLILIKPILSETKNLYNRARAEPSLNS